MSKTGITRRRRVLRKKRMGNQRKRLMRRNGTPAFDVHPAGYDPSAPDAKKSK
ncbi:MAG: hypothetical protein AAGA56_02715 [Myxococcota bacterium]